MNLDINNLDRRHICGFRRVSGPSSACCIDPRYQTGCADV